MMYLSVYYKTSTNNSIPQTNTPEKMSRCKQVYSSQTQSVIILFHSSEPETRASHCVFSEPRSALLWTTRVSLEPDSTLRLQKGHGLFGGGFRLWGLRFGISRRGSRSLREEIRRATS